MKRDVDSGLQLRFEATARMPSILQEGNGTCLQARSSQIRDLKANANGNENELVTTTNGYADVYHDEDAFQNLPKPQQDILLLDDPSRNIPFRGPVKYQS